MRRVHELKTWPEFYQAIVDGRKTFEVRKNDRGFAEGDTLYLREFDPHTALYTGREGRWNVPYLLDLEDGRVVMALEATG